MSSSFLARLLCFVSWPFCEIDIQPSYHQLSKGALSLSLSLGSFQRGESSLLLSVLFHLGVNDVFGVCVCVYVDDDGPTKNHSNATMPDLGTQVIGRS